MERPKGPHECGAAEARITCVWGSRRQPHMSVERPKGSHATCVWSGRGSHHMCVGQPKAAPHECVAAEKPTGVWNCQRLHHMCVGQPKATPTECGAAEGPTCVWSGRTSSRMCVGHPCTWARSCRRTHMRVERLKVASHVWGAAEGRSRWVWSGKMPSEMDSTQALLKPITQNRWSARSPNGQFLFRNYAPKSWKGSYSASKGATLYSSPPPFPHVPPVPFPHNFNEFA